MQHPDGSTRPRTLRRYASGIPAIGWALLSQSIWLPLLAIDAHDRWQSRVRELTPEVASPEAAGPSELANAPDAARSGVAAGPLLASSQRDRDPLLDPDVARTLDISTGSPQPRHLADQPSPFRSAQATGQRRIATFSSQQQEAAGIKGSTRKSRPFGSIQVASSSPPRSLPQAPSPRQPAGGAAILALATRSSAISEADPFAALPSAWREPMRKALQQLPTARKGSATLETARVIYVPSERLSSPATVPLAIQSDGSLDIFSRPADPLVIEELRNWSKRQPQAAKGTIAPVVIHLTPIPQATTAMVSPPSAAASQLRTPSPESRTSPSTATRPQALVPASSWRAPFLTPPPPLPPLPNEHAARPKLPSLDPSAASTKVTPDPSAPARSQAPKPTQSQTAASAVVSSPEPSAILTPDPVAAMGTAADSATTLNRVAPAPSAPASSTPAP